MGNWVKLKASDGHELSAYVAGQESSLRGICVLQEIFGVNAHIRSVCDRFADHGYYVVSPALFDRVERDVELGYDEPGMKKGVSIVGQITDANTLADTEAALAFLEDRKKAVLGFCRGGSIAWLAAARIEGLAAAVGFYGGGIAANKGLEPGCAVQLHFGAKDPHIPLADVEQVRAAHPEVQVFTYPDADHGFFCDARGSFHAESAKNAEERVVKFLQANLS